MCSFALSLGWNVAANKALTVLFLSLLNLVTSICLGLQPYDLLLLPIFAWSRGTLLEGWYISWIEYTVVVSRLGPLTTLLVWHGAYSYRGLRAMELCENLAFCDFVSCKNKRAIEGLWDT